MRRPILLSVAVLGLLICLVGGVGLFAALTDTARTGTNSVDSAPLAGSADIQLATATQTGTDVNCGTFSENLATGFFTASNVVPGNTGGPTFFCIRNVGSQPVGILVGADELVDTDTACTGDEDLHGDTTCGGNQVGELSSVLVVQFILLDSCSVASSGSGFGQLLKDSATTPTGLPGPLGPGATVCGYSSFEYPATATPVNVQKAQSDLVTWRFKFIAQA